MNFRKLVEKAKTSKARLFVLTMVTRRIIPFNRPHKISISKLSDHNIETFLPYRKRNFNHLRGLHACALATLAEFTGGFMLLTRLGNVKYRIIMKKLEMEYFYQGKKAAIGRFSIEESWLQNTVIKALETEDKVLVNCEVIIEDTDGNHLCTGNSLWQIKKWEKVKTSL